LPAVAAAAGGGGDDDDEFVRLLCQNAAGLPWGMKSDDGC
jgi:hypothetical protein